jgi:hypothetical protein
VFSPFISHLACELDQQRRLRELARQARVSAASRRRRSRAARRPAADFAADLTSAGEDVWRAFRF